MPVTETTDHYQVLGVARDAQAEELQRAYRVLARRFHPDVNKDPAADGRFQQIAEAYDVLSDPDTRERYDRFGPGWRQVPDGYDGPSPSAGAGPRAGGARRAYAGGDPFDGGGVDLEDLLEGMFGGRGRTAGQVAGADSEAAVELSVEDAFSGGRRRLSVTGAAGPRALEVDIPAGVVEGQRIRLAGQGAAGVRGGPHGDLYLRVHLAPHRDYRPEGRDLHVRLALAPWEAALGATVPVDGPGGSVQLTVPPGTSSGTRLRLRGRGLPDPRGTAGDLYAEVRVMVPPALSDSERELFSQLADASTFDPRPGHGARTRDAASDQHVEGPR